MAARFRGASWSVVLAGPVFVLLGGAAARGQGIEVDIAPPVIELQIAPNENGDVIVAAPLVAASPVEGSVFYAQPWGEDPSSLLNWDNVQKDLELLDEQRDKIRDAQRKMQDQMQKHFAEMREQHERRIREAQQRGDGGDNPAGGGGNAGGVPGGFGPRVVNPQEDFQKTQQRMKELREELTQAVDDVLLPHQKKRLEEISLRMKMKRRGTSGSLADTELAKTLGIDDAQKERIRTKAVEVQEELEEKIAKLREEAREEILDELSPEQKRKLKDMLGADFDERPRPIARPRIDGPRPPAVKKIEPKAQ